MLLLEVVLRAADVKPQRFHPPRWLAQRDGGYVDLGPSGGGLIKRHSEFQEFGVLMGEWVPGAEFKMAFDSDPHGYFDADQSIPVKINSLGLRGPEATPEKPRGTYRILGLGDSFTMGFGVRDEDTFLRRLERGLNEGAAGRYEVLNAGVGGYNTYDEVVNLEFRWLKLAPDAVLITFYLNDAYDDAALANQGQLLGIYFQPDGLARYSYLADYVQHAWRVRSYRDEMREYYTRPFFAAAEQYNFTVPAGRQLDWPRCRSALARAVQLAEEHDFALGLAIFPELHELDGEYPFESVHRLVRRSCEELGIPTLDLLDAFRGRDERPLWVHPSDHHPNHEGHRIAAEAIEPFLRRLLPAAER